MPIWCLAPFVLVGRHLWKSTGDRWFRVNLESIRVNLESNRVNSIIGSRNARPVTQKALISVTQPAYNWSSEVAGGKEGIGRKAKESVLFYRFPHEGFCCPSFTGHLKSGNFKPFCLGGKEILFLGGMVKCWPLDVYLYFEGNWSENTYLILLGWLYVW